MFPQPYSVEHGQFRAQLHPSAAQSLLEVRFTTAAAPTAPLSWARVLSLWQQEAEFQRLCTVMLAETPYSALFWEMPPLTPAVLNQPYECVLIDSPSLAKLRPNPKPFAQHLAAGEGTNGVAVFTNLGGDAQLIAPCQNGDLANYTHIATFMRSAPWAQIAILWSTLGQTIAANLSSPASQPLWVSTSGLGVAWLHIRLDTRPKYYQHQPYKS